MIAKLYNWENAYIEICYSQWFSFQLNISSLTILFFWYLAEHVELLQSMYSHLAHSRSMTMLLEGTSKRGRLACKVSSSVLNTFEKHSFLKLPKLLDTAFKLIMRHDKKHSGLLAWMTCFSSYWSFTCILWYSFLCFYGFRSFTYVCISCACLSLLLFCCCLFVCFLKRKHGVQWVRSIWEEMREGNWNRNLLYEFSIKRTQSRNSISSEYCWKED